MAIYVDDDALEKIRPDIFQLGVSDWDDQMDEAEELINRTLESRWYREQAEQGGIDWRSTPMDPNLFLTADTQLKRLASYKTLELCYLYLMKNVPSDADAFDKQRKIFRDMYKGELSEVLAVGLDYDWDEDDAITAGENIQPALRRLHRV